MMMNYHSRIKRRTFISKPVAFLLFCLFILSVFFFSPVSNGFRFLAHSIRGDKLIKGLFDLFASKRSLIEENTALELKISELELGLIERDVLIAENEELKGIKTGKNSLVATVLLHPGFSPFDTLFISKGASDSVELGDLVLYHSLVIGEISEVNTNTSRVVLFSMGDKTFPVRIGKNRIEAEARGLGGGTFEVRLPKNVPIENGDPVLLSADKPRIFGRVEDIEFEESDAFQRILFALPININNIDFVTIEKHDL